MYCLDLVFGCSVLLLVQLRSHFHSTYVRCYSIFSRSKYVRFLQHCSTEVLSIICFTDAEIKQIFPAPCNCATHWINQYPISGTVLQSCDHQNQCNLPLPYIGP
jgi:hypothetical protein